MSYLSDEELEALITNIEENDLILAPPDLLDQILHTLEDGSTNSMKVRISLEVQKKEIREFRKYCLQVITSIAATIALIFWLPTSVQLQKFNPPSIPSKDMIVAKDIVKTKSDVLKNGYIKNTVLEKFFNPIDWSEIFE